MQTTIMDKSLGTLLRFWGIFLFTQVQPLPSPHKQCWTRVSRIFSEFQLCIGGGGRGENCRKISKRMHCFKRESRNDRKNKNITVQSQGLLSGIVAWAASSTSTINKDSGSFFITFLITFQAQLHSGQFPETPGPKLKGTKLHQVSKIVLLLFFHANFNRVLISRRMQVKC